MRELEEDAARWRLEADRFLRKRASEGEAAELAKAHLRKASTDLTASRRETSDARSEAARVAAELEAARAALVRLNDTRLFRFTVALRNAFAGVRRAFGSLAGRRP